MSIRIIEFKARVESIDSYEEALLKKKPFFKGEDHQIDTYFNATQGRLKLREGNIENTLIQYNRENTAQSKLSSVTLCKNIKDPNFKVILTDQLGVKVVVDKIRKIYFIDNVKFHFDKVKGLGKFIEVEAIDESGEMSLETLREQCDSYMEYFGIKAEQLVEVSYSDLLLRK
jgi:predicted adenylyl cyclase CyaB